MNMHEISESLKSGFRARFASSVVVSVLALSSVAGPLYAADIQPGIDYTPPVIAEATTFSWAGAYLGVVGGYNWNRDDTVEYVGTSFFGTHPYRPAGYTYGVKAGYNFDFTPYIAGVEGDFEGTGITGGFTDPANLGAGNPGGIGKDTVFWQGSLRGRLGVSADKVMVFGTAGLAFAQIQNSYKNPTNGITELFDKFRTGWTVGAGVDYAVTDRIIIGAEYRHTEFSTVTNVSVTAYPGSNISAKQAPTSDAIRLSVSYKF